MVLQRQRNACRKHSHILRKGGHTSTAGKPSLAWPAVSSHFCRSVAITSPALGGVQQIRVLCVPELLPWPLRSTWTSRKPFRFCGNRIMSVLEVYIAAADDSCGLDTDPKGVHDSTSEHLDSREYRHRLGDLVCYCWMENKVGSKEYVHQ